VEDAADGTGPRAVSIVWARRWCRVAVSRGAFAAVVLLLLSVDIFPIITNDSMAYLGHSNSIIETGFVQSGYRLVGYPFFLASVDAAATFLGLEPLLFTAVLQRVLVLVALYVSLRRWGWIAAPLAGLVLLPTMLVYTNLILTEGLAVGLVLIYGLLVARAIGLLQNEGAAQRESRVLLVRTTVLAAVVFVALVTVRFHYLTLGLGLAAILVLMLTSPRTRRIGVAVTLGASLLGGSFLAAASLENRDEFDVAFPSVRGERSQYWALWNVVFSIRGTDPSPPDLQRLYGEGSPYTVMGENDALPTYHEQVAAYERDIEQLAQRSNTSIRDEQFASIRGALTGGRIDDLVGMVTNASTTTAVTVESSIYRNRLAQTESPDVIDDRFNDGRDILPVITSSLIPVRGGPYFVGPLRTLVVLSALVCVAGLLRRRTRALAVVGLGTWLGTGLLMGVLLLDNVRFILVPLLFSVVMGTAVAHGLWCSRASSAPQRAGDPQIDGS
jgi:hypothetical protein